MRYDNFKHLAAPFLDVSHETFIRLQVYADLLQLWQPKINLVSQSTINDLWSRHFIDSLQLIKHLPADSRVIDFGSGGGFPAAVLAVITGLPFTLVESDQRKCAFLLEVARVTETPFKVLTQRIETLDQALDFNVITARAFAPLSKLLSLSAPWLSRGAVGIFLKGRDAALEIDDAKQGWSFSAALHPSVSDPAASILVVSDLTAR